MLSAEDAIEEDALARGVLVFLPPCRRANLRALGSISLVTADTEAPA
jgi:hypothetical protein